MSNSDSNRIESDPSSQHIQKCPPNTWSCEMCTYFNDNKFKKCQMCETKRPNPHNNNNNKDSNDIKNESDVKMENNNFKPKSKPKIKKAKSIIDLTNKNSNSIVNKPKQIKSKSIPKNKSCIHNSNSNSNNKNKKHDKEGYDAEYERKKEEEKSDNGNPKYKEALLELIQLITHPEPKYEYITNKTHELKDLIASKYPTDKYIIEGETPVEHYFDSIKHFLEQNGDNKAEVNIINKNKPIHQLQILKKYTIKNHKRVPKLNGQQGLKSLRKIYKGTVCGEYYGNYYLEHEFDAIYSNTPALQQINEYAFSESIEVNIPIDLVNYYTFNNFNSKNGKNIGTKRKLSEENNSNNSNNTNNKRRKLNDGKSMNNNESDSEMDRKESKDNIKTVKQKFTIVIDGYGPHQKSILIYMNDCRKHLMFSEATDEDEEYRNIDLVTVNVNGWPHIFAIAIKNIEKDEELLAYYGSNYIGFAQTQMLYENNMKCLKNKIDAICREHDIKK